MVTPAEFKAEYTEFASLDDATVQFKLDEAYLRAGAAWGDLQDTAAKLLTAHLLWLSPLSEPAARAAGSPYLGAYDKLLAQGRVRFFGSCSNAVLP
jgi:hypothetical protein